MKAVTQTLSAVLGVFLLGACATEEGGTTTLPGIARHSEDSASEVTSIDMSLPDRSGLKAAVADIEVKMNAYRLVVAPVDATCANATTIDQLSEYSNSAKISAALVQGCDYDVTLLLGHRPTDADQAATKTVSYEGKIKDLVTQNCLQCHKAGATKPELTSFDQIKTMGPLLVSSVQSNKMPLGNKLSAADKAAFVAWQTGGFAEKDAAPVDKTKLSQTYYKNDAALRITKEQIQGQASLRVALPLKLQAEGQAIGLGK